MSRLTEDLINPCVKFFSWDGTNGGFEFYDRTQKTDSVKGVNVAVPLPFRFLFLEKLSTIKGYNSEDKTGYFANEVMDISKEVMIVRTKKGVVAKGIYKNVIDSKECRGAKYCQSVYIAYKDGGKMVICNLQLVGAAVSAWIEFCKKNDIKKGAIAVETMLDKVNGATKYKEPVFKKIPSTPESETTANALCVELEIYLAKYFKRQKEQNANTSVAEEVKIESHAPETKSEPVKTAEEELFAPSDQDLPF